MACLNPFAVMTNILVTELCEFKKIFRENSNILYFDALFFWVFFQELEDIHIDLANTLNGAIESHALLLLTKVSSLCFRKKIFLSV